MLPENYNFIAAGLIITYPRFKICSVADFKFTQTKTTICPFRLRNQAKNLLYVHSFDSIRIFIANIPVLFDYLFRLINEKIIFQIEPLCNIVFRYHQSRINIFFFRLWIILILIEYVPSRLT